MKVCVSAIGLWLGLVLFSGCQQAPEQIASIATLESNLSNRLDTYLAAQAANRNFSGSVLIAQGDSILYERSFGYASKELQVPNSDSTRFLIGSITKPFTAYAILLLEQEGRLRLDDRLSDWFPAFPDADKVTIRQLLTHTAGITDYHAFADWRIRSKSDLTPYEVIEQVKTRPFDFEPGARFRYSNTGYIFLGLIIEKVTGQSFEAFVENEMLRRMKLENTGVMTNDKIVPRLAQGYFTDLRASRKADYINYRQPFASGNMYSTPTDLWQFTRAVMKGSHLPDSTTSKIFNDNTGSYGYGWGIRDFDGVRAYGHRGGMNGFIGAVNYFPEGEYFICFLTNDDTTPQFALSADLLALVQGKEVDKPSPRQLVPLTQEMMVEVIGDYLIKARDTLHVFEQDGRLYGQETGQEKQELFPIGRHEYAFALLEFTTVFSSIEAGRAQTLEFKGALNLKAQRVERKE